MQVVFVWIVLYSFFCSGCGSQFATGLGAGAATGHVLTKTIEGAQQDLDRKEQQLIDAYNKGVEIGAEKETLDQIKKQIEYVQLTRKGLEKGNKILSIDWNDPQDIGTTLGGAAALIVAYLSRKQLGTTKKKLAAHKTGEDKFKASVAPEIAEKLYSAIGEARAKSL